MPHSQMLLKPVVYEAVHVPIEQRNYFIKREPPKNEFREQLLDLQKEIKELQNVKTTDRECPECTRKQTVIT